MLQSFTFALPHFDGEKPSPVFVEEHFSQEAQGVNKEGVFQLLPRVKPPPG